MVKAMTKLYEEKTGTQINISVLSYNEIYEAFVNAENFGIFDIFRIDVTWLSWFADKILLPLEEIDDRILKGTQEYIPAINGKILHSE